MTPNAGCGARLSDAERDALVRAVLGPTDDCAHNFVPLFKEVEAIIWSRLDPEAQFLPRLNALLNETPPWNTAPAKTSEWTPFACACGGEFKTDLALVACPECGKPTTVTSPGATS